MRYCMYEGLNDVLFHDEKALYSALFVAFGKERWTGGICIYFV
jgi:hypothetical protein